MGGIVSRSPGMPALVETSKLPEVALDRDLHTIGASPSRSLERKEETDIPLSNTLEALLLNADTLFVQDFIKKYPGCTDLPNAEKLVRTYTRLLAS